MGVRAFWVGAICFCGLTGNLPAQPKPPASAIVVARVQRENFASGQTFVGTVHPLKRSAVGSAVDGRVVNYPVNQGERVEARAPLCELLTTTISLQITSAKAELALRESELEELNNGVREEEIEQAKARMESALAVKEYSAARYKRTLLLAEQGKTVTREQLEQAQSTSVEADKTFRVEEMAYRLAKAGPRREKKEQAKAKVESQRDLVRQLEDQLEKHTMKAPFDGYVVSEHTEDGEWVSKGQIVATIVHLDTVEIEAHVLDAHIDHVRSGMKVRVEVPAARPSLFLGEVSAIVPEADTKTRTFPVKVKVKNTLRADGPVLKSGMLARVTLPTGPSVDSLLVPKDAIVLGGQTPMVYAVDLAEDSKTEGKVRPVPVQLGVAKGVQIAVEGTLEADQLVVVLGNERLRPGQEVRILREWKPPEEKAEAE